MCELKSFKVPQEIKDFAITAEKTRHKKNQKKALSNTKFRWDNHTMSKRIWLH